jgi:hypothetical protein
VRLLSLGGQVLRPDVRFTGTVAIPLGGLPAGAYIVELRRGNGGRRAVQTVVKL